MSTSNKSIPLQFWICYFLDSPDGIYPTIKPNLLFKCEKQGRFLVGSSPEAQSYGHTLCIFLTCLIYLIGLFGFVTNVINIFVLRKTLKGSSLQSLLVVLAFFELLACIFSIAFSTVIIVILENASRSESAIYALKYAHIFYSFGRTGAIYITILVAIERYLVVAFPIKSKAWLTPFRSRVYLAAVIILVMFLDLPFVFNTSVEQNNPALSPNTTLANFPYILKGTPFAKTFYKKVKIVPLILNYVAPFPFLLIFNGLLYKSIYNWKKSRQEKSISRNQKKEMSSAKMFSVVVLILLLCHTVACIIFFCSRVYKVIFRELMLCQMLSVTLSAAINFLVYYGFGQAFREEFWKLVPTWMPVLGQRKERCNGNVSKITLSSKDKDSTSSGAVKLNTHRSGGGGDSGIKSGGDDMDNVQL